MFKNSNFFLIMIFFVLSPNPSPKERGTVCEFADCGFIKSVFRMRFSLFLYQSYLLNLFELMNENSKTNANQIFIVVYII